MIEAPATTMVGLTDAEVERRRAAGQGNVVDEHGSRSLWSILRANVFTRFNAIVTSLVVVIFVFGEPIDAVFGLVMVANSTIGIVQELRAKRSLERVRVLLVPEITVVREGLARTVAPDELVLGDLIEVRTGDQIPVDAEVLRSGGLEVDESALTGESIPVVKAAGDEVLSGSFVVTGSAMAEARRVGEQSWAQRLTAEARTFALTQSELRMGVDRILRTIGWILPPLSALLLVSQLRTSSSFSEGIVWAVAGVVALVPQGLVLLVSMALAVAVIRLARQQVVVQELPAVEGLARIDVLCVDKTGTLTTGRLAVDEILPFGDERETLIEGLAALTTIDAARNSTAEAIRDAIPTAGRNATITASVPFSSVRKWSAVELKNWGAWYLGAPEILLEAVDTSETRAALVEQLDRLAAGARRVLLVARSPRLAEKEELPDNLRAVGLVALKEEVRPDAAATMEYFRRQHVELAVISGDNPITAAAVAAEVGIPGADHWVDMRTVESVESIPTDTVVYGRVVPEQKRDLVKMLQDRGHVVAMTGDGVNDIPSLKAADIGIAMDTATSATKATAQLVLLDGRFEHLPSVVAEGRRVIANMERVSALFVTKTVYAALLALTVAVAGVAFPFLPRHLSLVATFTIGVPAFALSFRRSDEPCRPGYLRRVMHFAVPSGFFAAVATFATYWIVRSPAADASLEQARTSATIALTIAGLWVLYRLIRPASGLELALLGAMVMGLVIAVMPSPLSDFYELSLPGPRLTTLIVVILTATIAGLDLTLDVVERVRARAGPPGSKALPGDPIRAHREDTARNRGHPRGRRGRSH
ncbi:MAG: HAD-IC family P-type ATPase [Acidimicrobiales bacterium]